MPEGIPIYLAAEDALSEMVGRRLLRDAGRGYSPGTCYRRGGIGYLEANIKRFNHAAAHCSWLVLADLDQRECAPAMIAEWLASRHPNLLLRIAVREIEAWLLADRAGLASFLGVRLDAMPLAPESLDDPKRTLLDLTRRSRHGDLKTDLLPRPGSTSTIGPNYNGRLCGFVESTWNPPSAAQSAPSLAAALTALQRHRPR